MFPIYRKDLASWKSKTSGEGIVMKRLIAAAAAMMICLCSAPVSASSAKAVFDFGDDAFFAVKMQENESVYLELDTTYDKQLSQSLFEQTGMEADRFYRFDTGEKKTAAFLRWKLSMYMMECMLEKTERK